MARARSLGRILGAAALGCALLGAGAVTAGATAKPADDLVPTGATVLYWSSGVGPVRQAPTGTGAVTVTNLAVIAQVRALINSLPVSTPHSVCPDDMMIPSWVSFATSKTSTPFTEVMFQLGGCPYARVYQHGVAISPTLGGTHLGEVYARIKTLIGVHDPSPLSARASTAPGSGS